MHQAEASRNPARAAVEPIGQLLQTEPEAPLQLCKQPALLDRRARLGCPHRVLEHQSLGLVKIPYGRLDLVVPELAHRVYRLETVDHDIAPHLLRRHDDYDGYLLTSLGDGRQQPALLDRALNSQGLVLQVKLMMLEVHLGHLLCRAPALPRNGFRQPWHSDGGKPGSESFPKSLDIDGRRGTALQLVDDRHEVVQRPDRLQRTSIVQTKPPSARDQQERCSDNLQWSLLLIQALCQSAVVLPRSGWCVGQARVAVKDSGNVLSCCHRLRAAER